MSSSRRHRWEVVAGPGLQPREACRTCGVVRIFTSCHRFAYRDAADRPLESAGLCVVPSICKRHRERVDACVEALLRLEPRLSRVRGEVRDAIVATVYFDAPGREPEEDRP